MGFKVILKDVTMPAFNQVLMKVYRDKKFEDMKRAYTLKRLVDKLAVEQKAFWKMYSELQEQYVIEVEEEVEKDGKKTMDKIKKIDPKRQDEFNSKIAELGSAEVEINWHQLRMSDLDGVGLKVTDLMLMKPILEDFDIIDDEPESEPSHTKPETSSPETAPASL